MITSDAASTTPTQEIPFRAVSGWPVLIGLILALVALISLAVTQLPAFFATDVAPLAGVAVVLGIVLSVVGTITMLCGFFLVNPNMSRVLVLFGRYRGTQRQGGFFWTNPFTCKKSVSLRANNISSEQIKVNDMTGNPIEVGAGVRSA